MNRNWKNSVHAIGHLATSFGMFCIAAMGPADPFGPDDKAFHIDWKISGSRTILEDRRAGQSPWHASGQILAYSTDFVTSFLYGNIYTCQASLIGPTIALTAGHCVKGIVIAGDPNAVPPSNSLFFIGDNSAYVTDIIADSIPHGDADDDHPDWALLRLSRDIGREPDIGWLPVLNAPQEWYEAGQNIATAAYAEYWTGEGYTHALAADFNCRTIGSSPADHVIETTCLGKPGFSGSAVVYNVGTPDSPEYAIAGIITKGSGAPENPASFMQRASDFAAHAPYTVSVGGP